MVELFCDNLEEQQWGVLQEPSAVPSDNKSGQQEIPDLLSWFQSFQTYIGGITSTQSTKSKKFLAYQTNSHCPRGPAMWG